ncbi:hypothetical protein COCSADRAFT_206543 [Bipolaris sorokiniana ND90Pr]|uniref:Uncharacterized protein n=1 Tax=Cochliobolus sativus (strain ND90Pr / ATCC 201652) TaxID=665912 RepID=M2T3Y5_COCSN|nr:uncharacterized protein COCSADRAFT_206543 [Bipolaris sorokiniana ND90Pr]EMD69125.1 hypothetical protein COCSADRAFT_206543 [Bipolaris sorokiniana ND90Pr]
MLPLPRRPPGSAWPLSLPFPPNCRQKLAARLLISPSKSCVRAHYVHVGVKAMPRIHTSPSFVCAGIASGLLRPYLHQRHTLNHTSVWRTPSSQLRTQDLADLCQPPCSLPEPGRTTYHAR